MRQKRLERKIKRAKKKAKKADFVADSYAHEARKTKNAWDWRTAKQLEQAYRGRAASHRADAKGYKKLVSEGSRPTGSQSSKFKVGFNTSRRKH